ncbi:MAG: FtsX-like permease family protein, partial [Acidobacteriota bacterium]|nr:FtsX-like permease family protein [Acidobacteriota bacterium]
MLAAAALVLLIASANVANLLMARSLARGREMAVRMALGAGYARLIAQLLAESVVLAAVAGSAGILVGLWMTQAVVTLIPKSLNVPGLSTVHLNLSVLGFALVLTLGTAVVCGLTSAFTVRTGASSGALISHTRVTAGAQARRSAAALVVTEVALAIVLLIGAGLILRTLSRLISVDPGFQADHVLSMTVQFPAARYRDVSARRGLYQRGFAALRNVQEIRAAGVAAVTPLTGNNWTIGFQRADQR